MKLNNIDLTLETMIELFCVGGDVRGWVAFSQCDWKVV